MLTVLLYPTLAKSFSAMISAMISLAHALNLQVVAEGVEEEAELNVLREHGCEYVQGYYFSKPLSVGDFTNLIVNTVTNKSSY